MFDKLPGRSKPDYLFNEDDGNADSDVDRDEMTQEQASGYAEHVISLQNSKQSAADNSDGRRFTVEFKTALAESRSNYYKYVCDAVIKDSKNPDKVVNRAGFSDEPDQAFEQAKERVKAYINDLKIKEAGPSVKVLHFD